VQLALLFDISIHRVLEQNGGENPLAVEARTRDDTRAHLMHDRKHFFFIGLRRFLNAVSLNAPGVLPLL
jgi:hypothetical protein